MASKPPVIGAAASDAQAAVGVCWYIPAGQDTLVIPGRSPFGSPLLVDHRLSGLCHFATNKPSANVYLGGETTLYTIHLS